ncbi:hypothetical protein LSM04_008447 [Trypanosoma melophagium]|uniref:uncharacterized protein n=1 Tax=Trypanosoma melophagium TaxID=715481 RepID=UPI00351A4F6A|nr:hypothetical protein LSM04_008447 [Trypanosoma melophagium]
MRSLLLLLGVVLLISLHSVGVTGSTERTADACQQLGIDKNEAKCRYCAALLKHTESAAVEQECLSCCVEDEEDKKGRRIYARARIELRAVEYEVSESRSEITMFYRAYKEKFGPRLSFVSKYNALWPRLVLEEKDTGEEFEMSIVGWTKDGLHDYLVQAFGMQS